MRRPAIALADRFLIALFALAFFALAFFVAAFFAILSDPMNWKRVSGFSLNGCRRKGLFNESSPAIWIRCHRSQMVPSMF